MGRGLLHIGYHKTGTKWLQRTVFAGGSFVPAVPRRRVVRDFVTSNQFRFDPAALATQYDARFAEIEAAGSVPVLSVERLSGHPHSGGFDSRAIADRIAEVLPSARILIVIREQRTMLASIYKEYVRMGGPMSFHQYTTLPKAGGERVPLFRFDHLEYDLLVRHYIERFSAANVLVLPFELLAADQHEFVRRIAAHVDIPPPDLPPRGREHPSSSALATALKRPGNRVFVRDSINPAAFIDDRHANPALRRVATRIASTMPPVERWYEQRFRATVAATIGHRYAESNAATAKLTGLDLAPWGYDVGEAASHR